MDNDEQIYAHIRSEYPEHADQIIEFYKAQIGKHILSPKGRWAALNKVLHEHQPKSFGEPVVLNSHRIIGRYLNSEKKPEFKQPREVMIGPTPNLRGRYDAARRTKHW